MTPQRIVQLAEAGFTFEAKSKKSWDERAVEWLEYKAKNGGRDPKRYDESGLGKWVYDQRDKYRQMKEGKKTNLTEEQIRRLDDWGFNWEFKLKMPQQRTKPASWEQRFQELCKYKEEKGHCHVPQFYPVLGQWVHSQRNNYRSLINGKKTPLSKERLQKLKSIGFDFGQGRQSVARKKVETLMEHGGVEKSETHDEQEVDKQQGVQIAQLYSEANESFHHQPPAMPPWDSYRVV
eukprot:CAMPEP_0178763542 /NCGR_PEP_ID=MMETSP0744-20121128/17227_1 /TAXON_ID=913974 /ORGANISM="Nitzschia punctata, Strain CCMP561" /LENGTH=234 /DNA_ID=CAMNT_0020418485 /DNA_START=55 /DNA_END=759 /DNA_ORIENTATION=-